MKRLLCVLLSAISVLVAAAQGSVKGKVIDKQTDEVLQFVNIAVMNSSGKLVKGAITDATGHFTVNGLADGNYQLQATFMGYKTVSRKFTLSPQHRQEHFNMLYMAEDAKMLKEVQVTGQRSQMKLEVDRKVFSVDQVLAAAGGNVTDLLENIPSIEVTTDGEISLRGNSSVEVWINGKASGLTTDNRYEILQQIPAESIEKIEVIDNPSAKFSPEGSTITRVGMPVATSTIPVARSMPMSMSVHVAVAAVGAARASSTTSRPTNTRITRVTAITRDAASLPVPD